MKNLFPNFSSPESEYPDPRSVPPRPPRPGPSPRAAQTTTPPRPIKPRRPDSHPIPLHRTKRLLTKLPPTKPHPTKSNPAKNSRPRIRQFLLLSALIALLSAGATLCACSGASRRSGIAELWKTGFRTEIEGTLSGIPFAALVHGKLRTDGTTEASVQYLSVGTVNSASPESGTPKSAGQAKNSGILLSRNPDGTVTVTRNDRTARISEEAASGLLAPLDCFLHAADSPIAAEQKPDGGTTLVYPDGTRLTLSPDGIPESGETETLHFRVVWWEPSA